MRSRVFRPMIDRLEGRTLLSSESLRPALATVSPIPRVDSYGMQRHQEIMQRIKNNHDDVVFFGDSMIANWETTAGTTWSQSVAPLGAANFGVASDWTRHLLWRLENGELTGRPPVVVVAIGTNDILFANSVPSTRVANTVAGIKSVLAAIRTYSPGSKVLLMGIFPQGETPADPIRLMIQQVNEQIARFADGVNVRFLDIGSTFLPPDGIRSATPLVRHPTPEQYEVWARAIHCPVQQWLGRPCAPVVQDLRLTRLMRRGETIQLTFNESLDEVSAENPANYTLAQERPRWSRRSPRRGRLVLIQRVVYDATAHTVSLVLSRPIPPGSRYTLTVSGTRPDGVKDVYGSFLDRFEQVISSGNYIKPFLLLK